MIRRIGAHISVAGGLKNSISNIEKIGGNAIQIFAGSPRTWARKLYSQDEVNAFNQVVDKKNLRPVFIHALYLVNLATDNPDLLEKSYQSLLIDMQNADLIHSAGIIVHIGSHQGRGFSQSLPQIVSIIQKILSKTNNASFIIENSAGQKGKIGSLEEIKILIEKINNPRLKLCLDTAHLFEAGYDLRNLEKINQLVQKLKHLSLLDKLVCLHLNDSKTELSSGRDIHENIGAGFIGKQGLSHFINHREFRQIPIILEVPGLDSKGPDKHNISLVQKMQKSSN